MTTEAAEKMKEASEPLAAELAKPKRAGHLKLYDAAEALSILDDLIEEHAALIAAHGGDIEAVPAIAELLAFAEEGFEAAVERWGLKIRSLVAEAEGVKIEADRLAGLQRQKETAAASLKDYLRRQLEARGKTKVATKLVTVRIQANSQPSITATSETVIEELYAGGSPFAAQKVEYVLDRAKILEASKNGEDLPEGIVVRRGTHLRVV